MSTLARSCLALLAAASLMTSCVIPTDAGFPSDARQFAPPAQFHVWWRVTEACSGRTGDYSAVRWYVVPNGSLVVDSTHYDGYTWLGSSPKIVIEQASLDRAGDLIRHEMLHILSASGRHLRQYYVEKCGGIVACIGECAEETGAYSGPSGADSVIAPEELEIRAFMTPTPVSRSADSSWVSVVVEARNPRVTPVWVRLSDTVRVGGISGVQFWYQATGGFGTSARYSANRLLGFAPGQTRRVVFDTRVNVPGVMDVQPGSQLLTGGFSSAKGTPVAFEVVR